MIRILVTAILFCGCASTPFENWTKIDTARQVAYTAFHCADWLQTRGMVEAGYHENNLVLGESPSVSEVDLYMGSTLILNTLIPAMLEEPYRGYWQYLWVGLEAGTVYHNYQIGVRF